MRVFSHCELDHFDGCAGCKGDGKGDCAAVWVDVPSRAPAKWIFDWSWRSWLFGAAQVDACLAIHIGPFCAMRIAA